MYGAKYISSMYDNNLIKQGLWIVLGLCIMWTFSKLNFNLLIKYSGVLYVLGTMSLVAVLFLGVNVNGATSWFKIGPFSFQPSELFKVFYLLYMSKVITDSPTKGFALFSKILFLTFIPCVLIFLEPDTGVVIMYLLLMFGLMWGSGIKKRYPLLLIGTGLIFLVGFVSLYFLNGDLFTDIFGVSFFYRMDRLLSFKNVSSYQLNNALIGVGASGLFGFGLQHKKMYIPEVTTDFVFDLTILNFGIIGGIFIAIIYAHILWKLFASANSAKNTTEKTILYGTAFMMSFQVVEHIFMNLGLTPITGITLPFLSYGGSSLLSYFLLFGIVLKITTNNSSYNRNYSTHKNRRKALDMV